MPLKQKNLSRKNNLKTKPLEKVFQKKIEKKQ